MTDSAAVQTRHSRRAHLAGQGDDLSLALLLGALDYVDARSLLEVGAGAGRCMKYIKARRSGLHLMGVEPEQEFRDLAYRDGLDPGDLIDGDASRLSFDAGSFDVVFAVGVLHHLPDPTAAIAEMLRVAAKAVFIADGNNFGQGRLLVRCAKQVLNAAGLWKAASWVKTWGKGYMMTKGDGLAYSYSVFNDYQLLRSGCRSVHLTNLGPAGINPYRTASHVAVLGLK